MSHKKQDPKQDLGYFTIDYGEITNNHARQYKKKGYSRMPPKVPEIQPRESTMSQPPESSILPHFTPSSFVFDHDIETPPLTTESRTDKETVPTSLGMDTERTIHTETSIDSTTRDDETNREDSVQSSPHSSTDNTKRSSPLKCLLESRNCIGSRLSMSSISVSIASSSHGSPESYMRPLSHVSTELQPHEFLSSTQVSEMDLDDGSDDMKIPESYLMNRISSAQRWELDSRKFELIEMEKKISSLRRRK